MKRLSSTPLSLRPAILGIVLAPFLTISLSFRHALIAQAILITVLTLATVRRDRQGLRLVWNSMTPALRSSLGFILLAGLFGAIVGLSRGSAMPMVGGQALSVLLLPIGACAAFSSGAQDLRDTFQRGLLEAALIGGLLQLVWGLFSFFSTSHSSRLFLPNSVSVVQVLPMALLFLMAIRARRTGWRWSTPTLGVLLLLLILSSLRSLWILVPCSIVLLILFLYGMDLRRLGLILMICILVAGSLIGGIWIILDKLQRNQINLLPTRVENIFRSARPTAADAISTSPPLLRAEELQEHKITGRRFPVPESPALLLSAESRGGADGAVVLSCRFLDPDGKLCGRVGLPLLPSHEGQRRMVCAPIPERARSFRIRISSWQGSQGIWELHSLQASPINSGIFCRVANEALSLEARASGLIDALRSARSSQDLTLSFRLTESMKTWNAFESAPLSLKLIGHGLGSTIRLDTDGFDNRGHWIHYDEVNYLHNWYLFLLFKLGIIGGLGILVCTVVWMWLIFKQTIDKKRGSPSRAFPAAALASWICYLIWSLTSPEILDFRMAPIWGFLLAATLTLGSAGEAKGNKIENLSERRR